MLNILEKGNISNSKCYICVTWFPKIQGEENLVWFIILLLSIAVLSIDWSNWLLSYQINILKYEAQNDNTYIIALGPLTFEEPYRLSQKYLKTNSNSIVHAMFQESLWYEKIILNEPTKLNSTQRMVTDQRVLPLVTAL